MRNFGVVLEEMANVKPTLIQSYPMIGGDGPHSYLRNSTYQKAAIESVRAKIKETILAKLGLKTTKLDLNTYKIADFGCSVGSNTLDVIQNIIETLKLKHQQEETKGNNHEHLEFHVFFNDQTDNDFNTLFKTLPRYHLDREIFACGVPGSFYRRLFPRNSLHIGHTSNTLVWLSTTPEDVCNRNSQAWNKNSILCTNLVEQVTEAYRNQFKKDMRAFIAARAQELVPGGLMIILGLCLPDGVQMIRTWKGVVYDMIRDCLIDMAKSGIIKEEKVESFKLPIYFPQFSELKEVIEQNGCFSIEVMEEVKHPMEDMPFTDGFIISMFRAMLHGFIEEHFGGGVVDELFDRFGKKSTRDRSIYSRASQKDMQYFILLKKKIDRS
ncbi:PREDICTED: probable S-adenosylmethionine-dependent methyltransferase At5g38780 [Tarenaya hassleriana]|uniref:probable S-adenosylmethionine-dependent methyltransferase At5g38780 n=1 Tax=Tarenaya hassleriana TaxID=28532 RepID=UPI00053C3F13|nr:PREDICTED: probable S-adenosylmethionine-dependent methyltransferase At5g38780 [Tarenaya hassleriana]